MFVMIGKQLVNLLTATVIDEGAGGQLRICTADGKVIYARTAEDIAAVKSAIEQLSHAGSKKAST